MKARRRAATRAGSRRRPSRALEQLRRRLREAEETIAAIQEGQIDALVVQTTHGEQVFTLRSADQPYRLMVEQMREGALTLGDDGTILFCNQRFGELVAVPPERVSGRPLAAFVAPEDEVKIAAMLQAERFRDEFRLRAGEGIFNPAQVSATALEIDGARTIAAVVTDLTHERTVRGLREANRLKDDFLATLSHELRTPLNAIVGWTQVMLAGQLAEPARHGCELIARNAQAQAQLINDLIDMSRITTGKLRLTMEPLAIVPLLEAAVESVRMSADAKGVAIETAWPAKEATILADATRLQQVFWNLLSNAVKFTPAGGHIRVRAAQTGDELRVEVVDTGMGIDPAFLPHVFDWFRQAESAKNRMHGGLGLGLAIVRELVTLHGGDVDVQSDGPGSGSTFIVVLPVTADVRRRHGARAPLAEARPRLEGYSVLLLEDHLDSRELLTHALEQAGATVAAFEAAAGAFAALEQFRPTVIVADIGLPGEDGYSFIRRVRAHALDAIRSVPAIAVTAYATSPDRAEALAVGFQHHLAKPVDPRVVVESIREIAPLVESTSG